MEVEMKSTRRRLWLLVGIFGACSPRTPERQTIEDAARAIGGREAIESALALRIEGEGTMGNLGQDMTPEATGQTFAISDYRQSFDLRASRMRVERTRTPEFEYFRGRDPMKQVFGIDGEVAYEVASDGSARRAPQATANELRTAYYHHPLTIVRAALDPRASVSNARTEGGESLVDVTTPDGVVATLAVDSDTKRPTRVTSSSSHPNLRDVLVKTAFADYEDSGGLMLPTALHNSIDDHRVVELRVTSQSVNGDAADLAAPEAAAEAEAESEPPPAKVTAEEVADGVWFLAGESHHSVLFELSDRLMLFEAPSEARTLAVIAKARELVPDKPLTHLVASHHHFDHSGGVRAAVSEGLTIVAQAASERFYRDLAARASTIAPDALARKPASLNLETVEDEKRYEDASVPVELYHIAGSPHADTLLMAYLPRQRLLVQADAFSPGRDFQPFAANLLENIQRRKLRVDRILPVHGTIVPFEDLVKATAGTTD
jgi:glyoxylase-like metal-dependent hydrolase (beta-lactamase superfamily II)